VTVTSLEEELKKVLGKVDLHAKGAGNPKLCQLKEKGYQAEQSANISIQNAENTIKSAERLMRRG